MCIFWRSHAQRTEILYTEEGEREMMNLRASIATAAKQDAACCRCLLFLFFGNKERATSSPICSLFRKEAALLLILSHFIFISEIALHSFLLFVVNS